MSPRLVLIAIVVWMVLLTGGYLTLTGGGHDPAPQAKATPTADSDTGNAIQPQATATPGETPTPSGGTGAPDPASSPDPSSGEPQVKESGGTRTYTPAELDRLRREDPDKYLKLTVDPQDANPAIAEQIDRELSATPAYAALPYSGGGVAIDFTGGRAHGKPELTVSYRGSRRAAERAVSAFMSEHNDRTSHYSIDYHRH